ncbi:aminopeptidase P family protein [Orientia tsutsugamushi]|uniref:Metallopeptidase M24 family protein n=1 Tax=Orientia tsutsugamushi str. TA716 TaxID=1359175 RepID=A0A0F3PBS9_ORITS|nr:aminopeptidase P family protein [Orientia tsutsugamushi]KJV77753.1 metallopeptidase M24 family protein [Orientia tsutsugamushi str. TA716]
MKHNEQRLKKLRQKFLEFGISGYIIPSSNEYQSECATKYARRLEYITGFSGSYGIAIITLNKAILFTDGRYLIQASNQVDLEQFQIINIKDILTTDWPSVISSNTDMIIGYDPYLFNLRSINYFQQLKLKTISPNLIDLIWNNQPSKPSTNAWVYSVDYAGQTMQDKISKLFIELKNKNVDGYFITDSTSICWLLNLRAYDTEFTPLMLSYAYLDCKDQSVYLFTNLERLNQSVKQHLNQEYQTIKLHSENDVNVVLNQITNKILVSEGCPIGFLSSIKNKQIVKQQHDLCSTMKACKNQVEINAAKQCHINDAVAVCEFFAWLDDIVTQHKLESINITEYSLSEMLTSFRKKQPNYICNSFDSICGFNENSAIIHYRPTDQSAKLIKGDGILLVDSGGQYLGGTTDITRTIVIGQATQLQKERYTLILKGHISLLNSIFPYGTVGSNLDVIARRNLWRHGLDYPHGTGHGVSNCLSVHEGPQSIGQYNNDVALAEGMILSNEPGYYEEGNYGIRIENLMFVKNSKYEGFLEFETLTLVPYCSNLILTSLLTNEEKEYIHHYYQRINNQVKPLLSDKAKFWIEKHVSINI